MQSIMVAHPYLLVVIWWRWNLGYLAPTLQLDRLDLVILLSSLHQVSVVLVALAQMVFLHPLSIKRSLLVGNSLGECFISSLPGYITRL